MKKIITKQNKTLKTKKQKNKIIKTTPKENSTIL